MVNQFLTPYNLSNLLMCVDTRKYVKLLRSWNSRKFTNFQKKTSKSTFFLKNASFLRNKSAKFAKFAKKRSKIRVFSRSPDTQLLQICRKWRNFRLFLQKSKIRHFCLQKCSKKGRIWSNLEVKVANLRVFFENSISSSKKWKKAKKKWRNGIKGKAILAKFANFDFWWRRKSRKVGIPEFGFRGESPLNPCFFRNRKKARISFLFFVFFITQNKIEVRA